MENYKPNSHRSKVDKNDETPEKKVAPVVSGKTKTKKNQMRTIKDVFISEDVGNVKSYIFMDVLVPAIKKAVSDIVRDGIDMVLYGSTKRSSSGSSKVSYRDYYDRRDDHRRPDTRVRSRFDYDDITYETRGDAEVVLRHMEDTCATYGIVTVSDMYEFSRQDAPYTGNKYGWTSLRTAEVERGRDGYYIKLPKAMPID